MVQEHFVFGFSMRASPLFGVLCVFVWACGVCCLLSFSGIYVLFMFACGCRGVVGVAVVVVVAVAFVEPVVAFHL